jgi:hypothetical protein
MVRSVQSAFIDNSAKNCSVKIAGLGIKQMSYRAKKVYSIYLLKERS